MSSAVLALNGLTYSYPGAARPALVGVDLEVEAGELVVVAGASGSGKSTLLRAASGLVPHFHGGTIEGEVVVCGMDTRTEGPGSLARKVGTLFQDPETQVIMGTARAELAFPLENRGFGAAAVARGVEEAALALGIAHLLDRPTASLSGGELQRVALGAALAGRPELVVLDEPTSQLDPVAGDELVGMLRRRNEDLDTAVMLAEHRLERCLHAADRVIALIDGRIACDAPPATFLEWALDHAPELATPGAALLGRLGLQPVPGVKAARAALRKQVLLEPDRKRPDRQLETEPDFIGDEGPPAEDQPALAFRRVWQELRDGPAILRGVTMTLTRGERIALMGRNGAGKSTLLRHASGLMAPTRGSVERSGPVALLLQNPTDYLVHTSVAEEASERARAMVGLSDPQITRRNPRDLSVGERQRLALAVVLDRSDVPAVICLDEPTRGMDRAHKSELAAILHRTPAAVLVATHDPEFAAAFAGRVILLADGVPIADGPIDEVLCGGTYFATETARIIGSLTPERAVARLTQEVLV